MHTHLGEFFEQWNGKKVVIQGIECKIEVKEHYSTYYGDWKLSASAVPTARGRATKAYRESKRKLGDDWSFDLTTASEKTLMSIEKQLGYVYPKRNPSPAVFTKEFVASELAKMRNRAAITAEEYSYFQHRLGKVSGDRALRSLLSKAVNAPFSGKKFPKRNPSAAEHAKRGAVRYRTAKRSLGTDKYPAALAESFLAMSDLQDAGNTRAARAAEKVAKQALAKEVYAHVSRPFSTVRNPSSGAKQRARGTRGFKAKYDQYSDQIAWVEGQRKAAKGGKLWGYESWTRPAHGALDVARIYRFHGPRLPNPGLTKAGKRHLIQTMHEAGADTFRKKMRYVSKHMPHIDDPAAFVGYVMQGEKRGK